jgi:hypothetical protein
MTATLLWKCNKLIVTQQELLRYYGNATNSLLHNRNYYVSMEMQQIHCYAYDCYVTMEMQQTHCYTTGTITFLWKCNKLIVTQQELLCFYGNAIWCIDHVTKENIICHIILKSFVEPTAAVTVSGLCSHRSEFKSTLMADG